MIKNHYNSKWIRLGWGIHLCSLCFALWQWVAWDFDQYNDFHTFYTSARVFVDAVPNLYDQSQYGYFFRYMPLAPLCYLWTLPFSFHQAGILSCFLNFGVTLSTFYLTKKLVTNNPSRFSREKFSWFYAIYLAAPHHLDLYRMGQNTSFMLLLLVLAYFFFSEENHSHQFLGGLLFGFACTIKTTLLLWSPLLLLAGNIPWATRNNLKRGIQEGWHWVWQRKGRFVGFVLPLVFNIAIFWRYPTCWEGFYEVNLGETSHGYMDWTFSISNLFELAWGWDEYLVFVVGLCFSTILAVVLILRRRSDGWVLWSLITGIALALFYFASWGHYIILYGYFVVLEICRVEFEEKEWGIREYLLIAFVVNYLLGTGIDYIRHGLGHPITIVTPVTTFVFILYLFWYLLQSKESAP